MHAIVRHAGHLHRVQKHLVETEEQAKDRAWYAATRLPRDMPAVEKESRSRAWANAKYFGMAYDEEPPEPEPEPANPIANPPPEPLEPLEPPPAKKKLVRKRAVQQN